MNISYKVYQKQDDFVIELGTEHYFVFSNDLHFVECVNLHYKEELEDCRMLKIIEKGKYIVQENLKNCQELVNGTLEINKTQYKQLPQKTKIRIRKAVLL